MRYKIRPLWSAEPMPPSLELGMRLAREDDNEYYMNGSENTNPMNMNEDCESEIIVYNDDVWWVWDRRQGQWEREDNNG